MTKDEMKNRISMALKAPILQQGFEIICKENAELKADNKALREKVHWWKKEVNVAHRARADEFEKLVIENKVLKRKLTYAKTIIQDLLDNTDEYARQRAEDFLKENE